MQIKSEIETCSFCPLQIYLKYLDAIFGARLKDLSTFFDADKMRAAIVKSELNAVNGP